MPLISIWDYLRERTKNAVLAGFQDALETVEQDDQGGSQYNAARRLQGRLEEAASRLAAGSSATPSLAQSLPTPGAVMTRGRTLDDAIDARLDTPPSLTEGPSLNGAPHPARRKRGRPRKDETR